MVHANAFAVAATALLAALPVQAGLYSKNSPVLQIDEKSYDRLISQSNYTSIIEFYAPWCGHCQKLQPAYEKAAKSLDGLAKVAAIDCDEESNKPFCGFMGVKGFPTLKIVRPSKTPGKPIVEDYQGPRTAKGIADAVVDKMVNLVKRVDDKTLEGWLEESNETAKAILFTDKGKTSALLKAVAIEFQGSIQVAQIRNTDKEKASLELFGISKFPTLLLLPGGKEAEGIVYDGEMKKAGMVDFLSKSTNIAPNPDPAPAKVKLPKSSKSKTKTASKDKAEFESASKSHAKEDGSTAGATATDETLVEEPTESPEPIVDAQKPIVLPDPAPPIPILSDAELAKECLGAKTGTCILALLPPTPDEVAAKAVGSLSEIAHRHKLHKRHLFPFYVLPSSNPGYEAIKKSLDVADTEIIAINARRGWYRVLPKAGAALADADVTEEVIENWVDSIRLGEGAKQKIPGGLVPEEPEEPVVEEFVVEDPVAEPIEKMVNEEPIDDNSGEGLFEQEPVAATEEPIVIEEVKVEEKKVEDVHDEL